MPLGINVENAMSDAPCSRYTEGNSIICVQ